MMLVTGCNERYYPRMSGYLDSLQVHADFPVWLFGVGFAPISTNKVHAVTISQEANRGAPPETESIQHGSFIKTMTCRDDMVVMYTDGDFVMQRPLNDHERQFLTLKHKQAIAQWNGGAGETLATEAGRIGQKIDNDEMSQLWGEGWQQRPIYNVGLLAMTARTWKELYQYYMYHWDAACTSFSHQARQQWLISYLLDLHFEVLVAPWHFHAHGHFGLKPGMERRADGIYADGKKALFRHYL